MGIVDKVKNVIPGHHTDAHNTATGHGQGVGGYSTGSTAERHGAGVPSVGLGEHTTGTAGAVAYDNKTSGTGHTGTGLGTTGTTIGSTGTGIGHTGLGTTGTTVGAAVPAATHTLGPHDTHHGHGHPEYVAGNTRLDPGHATVVPGNPTSGIAVVPIVQGGEKQVLSETHTTTIHRADSGHHDSHSSGHHTNDHHKKEGIIDKVKDAVGMGGKHGQHHSGSGHTTGHTGTAHTGYSDATPGYTSGATTGTTPGYTTGTTTTGTTPGYVGSTGTTTGPTGTTPYTGTTGTTGTDRII